MLENFKITSFNDKTPITKYTFKIHGSSWLNLNTRNSMNQWPDTADLNNLYDPDYLLIFMEQCTIIWLLNLVN